MGPVEALKIAVSKEAESIELYQKLSEEHPVAKDMFLFLMNEEEKHVKLIENKISELTKY